MSRNGCTHMVQSCCIAVSASIYQEVCCFHHYWRTTLDCRIEGEKSSRTSKTLAEMDAMNLLVTCDVGLIVGVGGIETYPMYPKSFWRLAA